MSRIVLFLLLALGTSYCSLIKRSNGDENLPLVPQSKDAAEDSDAPEERGLWILRYPDRRGFASATVGCLGASSYFYRLPTVDEVRSNGSRIRKIAKEHELGGGIWVSDTPEAAQQIEAGMAFDIDSREIISGSALGSSHMVFCRCKAATLGEHCSKPADLPPLGFPF